jgi:iron(III) transport system ATP-binding protein
MSNILEIQNLECRYDDVPVVKNFDLSLAEGEIGCLLGPSGCGKSTVLRAIAGFQDVHEGTIRLKGIEVSTPRSALVPEKRKIGMVFQDYALFPHLSVAANIGFGLNKLSRSERESKVKKMLDLVSLSDLANRFPHELSGGQQQRVALARALAPEPQLILLDEPFSNLDTELRKKLSLDVRRILKELGMSAILVTHDQQEAFAVSDSVGVIKDGKINQWDSPFNLYHEPVNRFVATFIGNGCFVKGRLLTPSTVDSELGVITGNRSYPWRAGAPIDVLIRPDDIVFDADSKLKAEVNAKTFAGTSTLYRLQLDSGASIECLFPSHQNYNIGDKLPIKVAADHLIVFASGH